VLKEDDQLKPEIGSQIVRKFIDKDKVDAIVALRFSNVMMASLPRIAESGVVAITTNSGPSPLAGAGCKANVFSTTWQNDGAAEAMGKFAQDRGVKKVYLMAPGRAQKLGTSFSGGLAASTLCCSANISPM
jgi:branched-chain amino acid transport system substrate-binding protein